MPCEKDIPPELEKKEKETLNNPDGPRSEHSDAPRTERGGSGCRSGTGGRVRRAQRFAATAKPRRVRIRTHAGTGPLALGFGSGHFAPTPRQLRGILASICTHWYLVKQ